MNSDEFDRRMRSFEYFHSLALLPDTWTVLRVDGHNFSRLTEAEFEKPFDMRFHNLMLQTAQSLLEQLQATFVYTESDEISILLPPGWTLFSREVEKLVSLSAGIASAAFTHAFGSPAHFDSRVWVGVNSELVVDYFRWRQADATRCALNGWSYWTLRQEGQSVKAATQALEKQPISFKNELLFQRGINFNNLPLWQRRGTGLSWETFNKEGVNPRTGETVTSLRRRVRVDQELPTGDAYGEYIQALVNSAKPV